MSLLSKEPLRYNGALKAGSIPPHAFKRLQVLVGREIDLIRTTYDTPEIRAGFINNPNLWSVKDRNTLPFPLQKKINAILKRLGYSLSIEYLARNEILRFGKVIRHNDSVVGRDGATVFIPLLLPRNEDIHFWHASNPEGSYTLNVGDIMVFDQNDDHAVDMRLEETDSHMGYGIVLFLDKLPPHPKDQ